MTPMIDVVFQLIIFFIVTINVADQRDETIRLEMGPHGQEIESGEEKASSFVVDVGKNGRISIGNTPLTTKKLENIIAGRFRRMGNSFQIMIRGDARASHDMVRKVMDTCTASGVGRVSFIAVKEAKTPEQKAFLQQRTRSRSK